MIEVELKDGCGFEFFASNGTFLVRGESVLSILRIKTAGHERYLGWQPIDKVRQFAFVVLSCYEGRRKKVSNVLRVLNAAEQLWREHNDKG